MWPRMAGRLPIPSSLLLPTLENLRKKLQHLAFRQDLVCRPVGLLPEPVLFPGLPGLSLP